MTLKPAGALSTLYDPLIFIRRRNEGYAGLSAMRASEIFNPMITGHQ
jgi:hypothetical protein